jgi:ABC-type lipoprotein export system ATPase subunit
MNVLTLTSVAKSYGSEVVMKDASLTLKGGDFVAIVGPSGSGKTTLLGIMGGLEKPSSGRVEFGGEDLTAFDDRKLSEYRNRKVGFVHQMFNLIPFLTASENVMVPMVIGGKPAHFVSSRAMELLDFVGMKGKAAMLPRQLSGGEQQRVAVARALSNEPEIILADEPTANLDEKNEHVIMEYLQRLVQSGKAVVLATHDTALAQRAARMYTIEEGILNEI